MVSAGSAVIVVIVGVVGCNVLMIIRRVKILYPNVIVVRLIDKIRKIITLTGAKAHNRRHDGARQDI